MDLLPQISRESADLSIKGNLWGFSNLRLRLVIRMRSVLKLDVVVSELIVWALRRALSPIIYVSVLLHKAFSVLRLWLVKVNCLEDGDRHKGDVKDRTDATPKQYDLMAKQLLGFSDNRNGFVCGRRY